MIVAGVSVRNMINVLVTRISREEINNDFVDKKHNDCKKAKKIQYNYKKVQTESLREGMEA